MLGFVAGRKQKADWNLNLGLRFGQGLPEPTGDESIGEVMVRVATKAAKKLGTSNVNMDIPRDMLHAHLLLAGVRHISDFVNNGDGDWTPNADTVWHMFC